MNTPNPFIPQGSVLEQNKRRSRMKLGVFCVIAFGVSGLTLMLIQGCKREQSAENLPPPIDTNTTFVTDTNLQPAGTNPAPVVAPVETNVAPIAPVTPVVPEAATTEYVVVKGDTLGKIAKNNHVSLKALEAANPNVAPTKLKVGQKLTIPAGSAAAPAATGAPAATDMSGGMGAGGETYTVKSGDTLTKIAKAHGTTVKAIENENNLSTTKIKVGQKLKIPASAATAAPAPAPAPVTPPATTPAPAGTPAGQ